MQYTATGNPLPQVDERLPTIEKPSALCFGNSLETASISSGAGQAPGSPGRDIGAPRLCYGAGSVVAHAGGCGSVFLCPPQRSELFPLLALSEKEVMQLIQALACVWACLQVSKAAADLMAYCEAHAKEDPLLTPVPASENPFREKKFFCAIL